MLINPCIFLPAFLCLACHFARLISHHCNIALVPLFERAISLLAIALGTRATQIFITQPFHRLFYSTTTTTDAPSARVSAGTLLPVQPVRSGWLRFVVCSQKKYPVQLGASTPTRYGWHPPLTDAGRWYCLPHTRWCLASAPANE